MRGSSLERFAREARIQLQREVKARLNLIEKGDVSVDIIENKKAVNALKEQIREKGEDVLVEEVAYTWFNRISALRFMDASGYNATMIVSPAEGKTLPEILSDALSGIIDEDVVSNTKDRERIRALVDGSIASKNPQSEIFRILLVASCNYLNKSFPLLFEKIEDYTDLLLPEDLLSSTSIITKTVNAISEEDTMSVEIIGWLYQYYISEKKDEVFASFKKGKKAGKDEIPAATQLFTPDWIVRYLVDNSLGRLWMLNHPESNLRSKMKYYIDPVDKEKDFIRLSSPEEIKVLDPCCGSGHMLTYAFDLLFDIYTECGYTDSDAVKHIIEDNLYGIEIDKRAGQLAYFALMMKAREKSRRILRKGITPNICILQKVVFAKDELPNVINLFDNPSLSIMDLMEDFEDADILGSLITPSISDIASLKNTLKDNQSSNDMFSDENALRDRVVTVLNQAEYLSRKYHIVVTNPPYMGNGNMCPVLKVFLENYYEEGKTDLMTAFMLWARNHTYPDGYWAMINLPSWMFISSFEDLRRTIVRTQQICSLNHLGRGIFGSDFGTVAFVCLNSFPTFDGIFRRLFEQYVEVRSVDVIENLYLDTTYKRFIVNQKKFDIIPGSPIAYWASETIFSLFAKATPIVSRLKPCQGLATGDNGRFLRFWWEISTQKACYTATSSEEALKSHKKWFPYNKGGEYRKWYGNYDYLVNWENDGYEIKHFVNDKGKLRSRPQNTKSYFLPNISWSKISSGIIAFRFKPSGTIYDVAGPSIFGNLEVLKYTLGYMNSSVTLKLAEIMSPTINYEVGQIASYPLKIEETQFSTVKTIVDDCIRISKQNWDSFETSWDFKCSPLLGLLKELTYEEQVEMDNATFKVLKYLRSKKADEVFYADSFRSRVCPIESAYIKYRDQANENFYHLKMNEEELNRIFIDIYGLQDELKPEEDDSMVSVHRIFDNKSEIPDSMKKSKYVLTKEDVIKAFISYVVGCMFGRYDASRPGLVYAGGEFDISSYSSFVPDNDNVIPILGDSWFKDDAETYFIKFIEMQFGHDSLNENIKFIENALGKSIREYFYKDFYKDHLKTYQNRPIYWMFSSPKGYFQVLVYMHRYNENTANVVLDYLRQFRDKIRLQIKIAEDGEDTKKKIEYESIDKDLNDYEMNTLYPLAIQHLTFDLDDGVKANYQKLGNALKKIK